ncbi:hypothetical protein CTI12_AA261400 [Artemisia annua]|uniref:Replication factor-A protein 1 N-terminal domain-containing protein n=1 Tax=Artemisia annua TaxID=35608 RepID=A0A2U1NHU3_ARTAN|nr:hypothetical protein CTI12_AA261400 [Artemisia annua]
MADNLTPGAISMLLTGKHTVMEPVVQVIKIKCTQTRTEVKSNGVVEKKKSYDITLSDGLVRKGVGINEKINEMIISNQLQKGSVVQLTEFSSSIDDFLGSDDIISGFGKDVSTHVSTIVEKTIEDGLGACYKTLGTLEEGVSKMTKLMMEKSKEVDAGFKKLETLEEDVFKVTKLMMEKSKEVDAGLKKLEKLEEDVSKLTRITMEKSKEDDVSACYKKLETLEEDVSKLTRMMMEKNKEDDMGACIEKLDKMGWGAEEPIYDTALLLFLKGADYRKLWLHLKPECCGKWVKISGSIFGLLD